MVLLILKVFHVAVAKLTPTKSIKQAGYCMGCRDSRIRREPEEIVCIDISERKRSSTQIQEDLGTD